MFKIREAIIVEGIHDKIRLEQLVDTMIITTDGFRIYKNSEKILLIKRIAETRGIIILTDSDSAGRRIRSHLKQCIGQIPVKHAYIPQILGKERRKPHKSAEGFLGVEGMNSDLLKSILKNICTINLNSQNQPITKLDLYENHLSGHPKSTDIRNAFSRHINLPANLSANALMDALNSLYTRDEFESLLAQFSCENGELFNS